MQRRHEIEVFADCLDEPSRALFRSAIQCQDRGDLEAAARIAQDQATKRPRLRWLALLLALESVEMRLGGAVKLTTPTKAMVHDDETGFLEERWGELALITYPEDVIVFVQFEEDHKGYVLRGQGKWKEASVYDKLVGKGLRMLCSELAAHVGVSVTLGR
jgi:hypothetical protein